MAMGLRFSGRRRSQRLGARMTHVLGSALGGAISGTVVGGIGFLLLFPHLRPWIIGLASVLAMAARFLRVKLGRRRQVPRSWARRMALPKLFLLWGMLLGCGFATETAYP